MGIDDYNFARDPRNCQRDPERIIVYDDDETPHELPTVWEVCPVCDGKGSHVNPAIDAGGIAGHAFREEPEFLDAYRRGDYDQPCNRCGGRSTVRVVDRNTCPADLLERYDADAEADADYEATRLAEIRMGA